MKFIKMETKEKISLVLSTYNGHKFIKKQLDSIRTQICPPDEVIIHDDCSVDETVSIINDYIKVHNLVNWKITVNERNLGYRENFRQGVLEATGDYIFLCYQDDIWRPEKILIMLSVFKAHPEIWSLNSGVELIDAEDKPIEISCEDGWQNANFLYAPEKLDELTFFDLSYILRHNVSPGCTMVIDKRTKNGFIETYDCRLPHDWYMNMIAAANGGCAYLNNNLILYRRHSLNAIGANTGIVQGIKGKTRTVRIEDYEARLNSCINICRYYRIEMPDTALLKGMISFYKSPNLVKLVKMRRQEGYKELAKRKVKLWELVVAIHFDGVIRKVLGV